MTQIQLVVGDWSDDGHGKTSTVVVEADCGKKHLEAAFKRGVEKLGVDVTDACEDYDDDEMPRTVYNTIKAVDPDLVTDSWSKLCFDDEEDHFEEDVVYMAPDMYAVLWMLTAKAGDPDLKWSIVADVPKINIGGYGFFS